MWKSQKTNNDFSENIPSVTGIWSEGGNLIFLRENLVENWDWYRKCSWKCGNLRMFRCLKFLTLGCENVYEKILVARPEVYKNFYLSSRYQN